MIYCPPLLNQQNKMFHKAEKAVSKIAVFPIKANVNYYQFGPFTIVGALMSISIEGTRMYT